MKKLTNKGVIRYTLSLLTLLSLLPTSALCADTYDGNVVAKEGAWCWFADPRALHYENADKSINMSWMGYIDVHGSIKAMQMDFNKNKKSEVLVRSYFQPDDHDNPTFLVLPDERVMVFYTRHTDEAKFYYRISVKPGDISQLGEEKTIVVANNTTYPSPFILSDDPTHIYLCWRGINWHPTMAKLSLPDANDNVTIEYGPYQMVQSTGARPYAKYQSNGKDKLYVTYTTGHPDNEYPDWLYFNVIDINKDGADGPILRDIKGNQLSVISSGTFNVNKTDAYKTSYPYTLIDAPTAYRDWVWQIARDKNDNPVVAMVRIDNAKTSHEYYYARWTGTEWRLTDLVNAGGAFHANASTTEKCYSGGMALDPDSINNIYLSVPTQNVSGAKVYEIWKYTVGDDGVISKKEQMTRNSSKNNVRPFILPNSASSPLRLCWMNGDYYYWMVNTTYPLGYPTSIRSAYKLPTEDVKLNDALVAEKSLTGENMTSATKYNLAKAVSSSAFTVSVNPNVSSAAYNGVIFTIGDNITLGLNSDPRLYVTIGDSTYKSTSLFYTSDNWATKSSGTSGDWWPTNIGNVNLTLTYDGSYLIVYRNSLIEQKIAISGLTLGEVNVGGFAGTMGMCDVYSRALNQDEIASLVSSSALKSIKVPSKAYTDIVLPTTASNGSAITWISDNENIISNKGIVSLPSKATAVTLKAVLDGDTATYNVTVLPRKIENNEMLNYQFETSDTYKIGDVTYVKDKTKNGRDLAVYGSAVIDGTLNTTANSPIAFTTNGYAVAPAGILDSLRSYTFLFRAKASNLTVAPRFYDFGVSSGNSLFFRANALSAGIKYNGGSTTMITSSTSLVTDSTYDFAVNFDASTHTTSIYINGELNMTGTANVNEPYQLVQSGTDTRNYISRTQWWDNNTNNGDFVGTIDNFRLYNISLTKAEIDSLQGYDYHEVDSTLFIDRTDSIINNDFESTYSVLSNSGVTSDRAIYVPKGWTAAYTNANVNDMSILCSSDLQSSLFSSLLSGMPADKGAHTYIVRQKWGASTIQFSQETPVLPAGYYVLTPDIWYSGGTGSAVIFAQSGTDIKVSSTYTTSLSSWQKGSLPFQCNGLQKVTVGFASAKLTNGTESFCGFDNFRLTDVTAGKNGAEILSLISAMRSAVGQTSMITNYPNVKSAYEKAGLVNAASTWNDIYNAYVAFRDSIQNPKMPVSVKSVNALTNESVVRYDLNGRQIPNNSNLRGLYIEKSDKATKKVIIR